MKLGFAFKEVRLRKFPDGEKRQYEIAQEAGISQTYLSQIEQGKKVPTVETIQALCTVYDLPPAILFWMALDPSDIDRKKRKAYAAIKEPLNNLIELYFS